MIFFKTLKKPSFYWVFILVFFLYGFSTRLNSLLLVIPITFFLIYLALNIKVIRLPISSVFLIYISFLLIFVFFLLLGGLIGFDFNYRVSDSFYYIFTLFPLFFVFYYEINKSTESDIFQNLFFSYLILGSLLFVLLKTGVFDRQRYQHVGNCLAATSILALALKNKKVRWVTFVSVFIMLLFTGSRQSLFGVLFVGVIYLMLNRFRLFITLIILVIIVAINFEYFVNIIYNLAVDYDMFTLKRLLAFTKEGGGTSVVARVEVYNRLFNELTFYPNLSFSPNEKKFFPHNYFLEYSLTSGYIIGGAFTLFIIYSLTKMLFKHKNNVLLYFSLFYILPFNVSSGLAASKYFLFYFILIIELNKLRERSSQTN